MLSLIIRLSFKINLRQGKTFKNYVYYAIIFKIYIERETLYLEGYIRNS